MGNGYNGNNQLNTATYGDGRGNVTQLGAYQYQYDAENHLVSATVPSYSSATYEYDGDGRRVLKQSGGLTTHYVYDPEGHLAAEYVVTGAAPVSPCTTCYVMADHLGSTRMATGGLGSTSSQTAFRDYLPFGYEILAGIDGRGASYSETDNPRQKFTGKERDPETGLDYFGARYFSAAQGVGRSNRPAPTNRK